MRVVVDQAIPFIEGILENYAQVSYLPGDSISKKDLEQVDMLIVRTRTQCNASLLRDTPVKYIFTATIGTDHIDLQYCEDQGIQVQSAIGCNVGGVAQYVITTILLYAFTHNTLPDKLTLGIVGAGHVGEKLAQYASALGMNILLNDPPRSEIEGSGNFSGLYPLLQQSDIVSFHVPLTRSGKYPTVNMVNQELLDTLKPNSLFINTSRGDIVRDEQILCRMAESRNIKLVLDVWKNEPEINIETLQSTWLASPHIAGYSLEGKWNATRMALDFFSSVAAIPNIDLPILPKIPKHVSTLENTTLDLLSTIYNIQEDCETFKHNPFQFEAIRDHYTFRREFGAYILDGLMDQATRAVWQGLDFKFV